MLCVTMGVIFMVPKHFSNWNHVFVTTLHNTNITYAHQSAHARYQSPRVYSWESWDVSSQPVMQSHLPSQVAWCVEGSTFPPCFAHVTSFPGTEIPTFLPFPKSHFLQETFWNNPPNSHGPLPLWPPARLISGAVAGLLPYLASDLIYMNSSCLPKMGVETWLLHLRTHQAGCPLGVQRYSIHNLFTNHFKRNKIYKSQC